MRDCNKLRDGYLELGIRERLTRSEEQLLRVKEVLRLMNGILRKEKRYREGSILFLN